MSPLRGTAYLQPIAGVMVHLIGTEMDIRLPMEELWSSELPAHLLLRLEERYLQMHLVL
jgi:hypothetical protein